MARSNLRLKLSIDGCNNTRDDCDVLDHAEQVVCALADFAEPPKHALVEKPGFLYYPVSINIR